MMWQKTILLVLLSVSSVQAAPVVVIRNSAQGMEYLSERSRHLAEREYPRMIDVLCETKRDAPKSFVIVFESLRSRNTAETNVRRATIMINADYFGRFPGQTNWMARHPETFDMVLLHEMAHVIQQYGPRTPEHLAEGIADYARYKLGYTNGWSGPNCAGLYRHYTQGYHCAGAFLLYIDAKYGANVVRRLNTVLRKNDYSDSFFRKHTGHTLEQLWAEFANKSASSAKAVD